MSENYFDWLQRETPTRWWHDSGNPDEIALALQRHAMGVTTNPVLTYRTFNRSSGRTRWPRSPRTWTLKSGRRRC